METIVLLEGADSNVSMSHTFVNVKKIAANSKHSKWTHQVCQVADAIDERGKLVVLLLGNNKSMHLPLW